MKPALNDDRPTLAALGVIAFALADVSHEALGHGLATLAVGGKAVLLTTCNFDSSGNYSKWIAAAGGLMNLVIGFGSLAVLRLPAQFTPLLRYFLVLVAAFNLFFAFGYPAYSGVARFGDWAQVISGLEPPWLWRVVLVVVAVVGYYGSMKLLGIAIVPFAGKREGSMGGLLNGARLQRITLIPYVAAMILACAGAALNPQGWHVIFTAGLPSAAAAFGLTQMDHFVGRKSSGASQEVIEPMQRNLRWIMAAMVVMVCFVGVLGPGIRFR